jgi:hypothetical protein
MNRAHHNQGQKLRYYGSIVTSICFCDPFIHSVESARLLFGHRRSVSLTGVERFLTTYKIPTKIEMEASVLKFPLHSFHGDLGLLQGVS